MMIGKVDQHQHSPGCKRMLQGKSARPWCGAASTQRVKIPAAVELVSWETPGLHHLTSLTNYTSWAVSLAPLFKLFSSRTFHDHNQLLGKQKIIISMRTSVIKSISTKIRMDDFQIFFGTIFKLYYLQLQLQLLFCWTEELVLGRECVESACWSSITLSMSSPPAAAAAATSKEWIAWTQSIKTAKVWPFTLHSNLTFYKSSNLVDP